MKKMNYEKGGIEDSFEICPKCNKWRCRFRKKLNYDFGHEFFEVDINCLNCGYRLKKSYLDEYDNIDSITLYQDILKEEE
ncbi:MAG: hypothetical protein L6408_02605 [Nanoarchaeota archaeon]|nr:hypothetical protein [Nanoarchaeota archaeon]